MSEQTQPTPESTFSRKLTDRLGGDGSTPESVPQKVEKLPMSETARMMTMQLVGMLETSQHALTSGHPVEYVRYEAQQHAFNAREAYLGDGDSDDAAILMTLMAYGVDPSSRLNSEAIGRILGEFDAQEAEVLHGATADVQRIMFSGGLDVDVDMKISALEKAYAANVTPTQSARLHAALEALALGVSSPNQLVAAQHANAIDTLI